MAILVILMSVMIINSILGSLFREGLGLEGVRAYKTFSKSAHKGSFEASERHQA